MSAADAGEHPHEIIIVKRGHGDHEEGHHGGVWKIAFADFMTAMMCFFLVMWLINAANEQTKAAVASYFNPVKLIDRNASRKGLEDLGDGPHSSGESTPAPKASAEKAGEGGEGDNGSAPKQETKLTAQQTDLSDAHLFADPYAVLAEIATDTGVNQNVSQKGDGGAQNAGPATGASGGESYRDPFAPDFWSQQVATPGAEASAERTRIDGDPTQLGDKIAETEIPKVKAVPAAPEAELSEPLAKTEQDAAKPGQKAAKSEQQAAKAAGAGAGQAALPAVSEARPTPKPEGSGKAEAAAEAKPAPAEQPKEHAPSAATQKVAAEIQKQLAEAFQSGDMFHGGLSVKATDKGVAISVTDKLDFGMFEIGSAMPRRELVLAMEKIGRIINDHKGTIEINGHTDARPFKSDTYDNWRLSTARAHSAYYMLVRGGVEESRVTEVAGFADRDPKLPSDPYAAVNRRIEILLETGG